MRYFKTMPKGYIYDKRIFWGLMFVTLLILIGTGLKEKWNFDYYFYFDCEGGPCLNPIYNTNVNNVFIDYDYKKFCTEPWCYMEYVPTGSYGRKPPLILKIFPYLLVVLFFISLLLNHFIHNRGKKPELELNLSEKWKNKLKRMGD